MHYIKCIFNNNLIIDYSNIISFSLEKYENNLLKANIVICKKLNNELIACSTFCKILINDKEYFKGDVKSIQIENDYIRIVASNIDNNIFKLNNSANYNLLENNKLHYNSSETNIINNNNTEHYKKLIEKFKINNPLLFQHRNNNGINNDEIVTDIANNIIKDSLIINIDKSLPISELDLNISASWNKLCSGHYDLTNKIKNQLKNGLISTLTPKKLIKSWPKLFDRLINNNKNILKTKYFITHSKLEEVSNNLVNINNIKIQESSFDFKLSVGWEYYQFITENLHCKIFNDAVKNSNNQVLNINLHNVQEYIEDNTCNCFFKTEVGNSIANIILCEVKQFIINSMQNITIQFQIPFEESLKINQKIKINNYIGIINKIEIFIKSKRNIATITCIGSEYNNALTNATLQDMQYSTNIAKLHNSKKDADYNTPRINTVNKNIDLYDKEQNTRDNIIDVVESINIINNSNEQMPKIKSITDFHQINNILNENPTKLIIKLKPIKTEHNEIENIDMGNINL